MQLTTDLTVRGPPSPCFQTVLRPLPAPAQGWGGGTHTAGLWAWATKATQVFGRALVWWTRKQNLCQPYAAAGRLARGPSTPAKAGSEAAIHPFAGPCVSCALERFSVAAGLSYCHPRPHHQPKPGAPGSLGWGVASQGR